MYAIQNKIDNTLILRECLDSALDKLATEIEAYPNDWKIWIREGEIQNSAGALCLFVVHKINEAGTFLRGMTLNPEQRNAVYDSRAGLISRVLKSKSMVADIFSRVTFDDLDQDFPLPYRGNTITTSAYLYLLLTEVYFHLGQINYHRKLV